MAVTPRLTPEVLSRISSFSLRARSIVDQVLAGQHRGRQRGLSLDFAEHRQYAPGDDIRYLDWKLYGRSDRFHIRQFEQEARLQVCLAVDASPSMAYAGPNAAMSKWEYARTLAAALGWLASLQHDEVTVATFAETAHLLTATQTTAREEWDVLSALESAVVADESRNVDALERWTGLERLAAIVPPRSLVVLLTDAFGEIDYLLRAVLRLQSRHCDVRIAQVIDPAERDFPFEQDVVLRDLEGEDEMLVSPGSVRKSYQQEFSLFLNELAERMQRQNVVLQVVTTETPFDEAVWALVHPESQRIAPR